MSRFIDGLKTAASYLFTYATLLNVILVATYAFKDSTYTFVQTLKYHFAFTYLYVLLPLFIATLIGKNLLYTEYPKLGYVVMPILCALPFLFLRPGKCSVSCDAVDLYLGLVIALLLAVRTARHMYHDHGEYMEFSHQKRMRTFRILFSIFLNIMVIAGITGLNAIHERNDSIIFELDSIPSSDLVSECSKIMFNNEKKALCLLYAGSKNHDVAICKKIRRLITENEDADRCYHELASYTGDIGQCNSIIFKEDKYKCYYSFPLSDDICAQIDDEDFQVNCFADCDKIADVTMKDSCFSKRAQDTKDVNFCNRISEPDVQVECLSGITSSAADCDKVADTDQRDECFDKIARADSDVVLCAKLMSSALKDTCIKDLATEKGHCSSISSTTVREVCDAQLATDVSDCTLLTTDIAKDTCYDTVAIAQGDSSLCKQIIDSSKQTLCETRIN